MEPIVVYPNRLRQFGPPEGSTFCFVTNSELADRFRVEPDGGYAGYESLTFDEGESFEDLMVNRIPDSAHVFVSTPNAFFQSPPPDRIGPRRKLMAMACNSTPTPMEAVEHFLRVIERTDPNEQQAFAERFFERVEAADRLEMVDEEYGTRLVFDHWSQDYEWNQQAGPIDWGTQQIAPSGEISVLPIQILRFNQDLRLTLNGQIAFKGQPILHNGTPSFTREDQARIYEKLAPMREHAVIATVADGVITDIRASHPKVAGTLDMMQAMFDVDSRYRIVWEIGFALNTSLTILPGNYAMNEVYGGTEGALHWGLGLTPYTQYHLDIICPGVRVVGPGGDLVHGTPTESIRRTSVAEAIP